MDCSCWDNEPASGVHPLVYDYGGALFWGDLRWSGSNDYNFGLSHRIYNRRPSIFGRICSVLLVG